MKSRKVIFDVALSEKESSGNGACPLTNWAPFLRQYIFPGWKRYVRVDLLPGTSDSGG